MEKAGETPITEEGEKPDKGIKVGKPEEGMEEALVT